MERSHGQLKRHASNAAVVVTIVVSHFASSTLATSPLLLSVPAAPRLHPLRSYQLLTRVHPWLPEPLRANVSGQAAMVQHALLAVNLPGSNAVPPHVVPLPAPAPGNGGGASESGGGSDFVYIFTEPLSIAVGRGFLDRHLGLLEAAGLVTTVSHGEQHGGDAGDEGEGGAAARARAPRWHGLRHSGRAPLGPAAA